MELGYLVPALAGLTLASVILFALRSKKKVEERMEDDDALKSTLAADAPNSRS
ncbi:MAG: hypothetical protein AAFY52_04300 [Pseudomonadota bacterium]